MPLALFFFQHNKWIELYYTNCTLKTIEEWNATGSTEVWWGTIYMTIGIICEIVYVPFMKIMAMPEFIQHSCYKFMFLLGCIDMVTLPANSIIAGIESIQGSHYCTNPTFYYLVGSVSMAGWLTATCTCCLLAIDRFLEICFPNIASWLFHGKLIYIWLSIPFIYLIVYWSCSLSLIYSIKFHAGYFDPFLGSEFEGNPEFSKLGLIFGNSIVAVLILGVCYGTLCITVTIKSLYFKNLSHMTKLQRVMLLQAWAICWEVFFVATVYCYNEFFPVPAILTKIEHTTWIFVHGDTPFVYLLLNKSLRSKFLQMLQNYTKSTGNTVGYFAQSVYTNQIAPRSPYSQAAEVNGSQPETRH